MPSDRQLVVDARDPHEHGDFWAAVLGYVPEQNAPMIEALVAQGVAREADTVIHNGVLSWADLAAICHPDDLDERSRGTGSARRILFQRVPEAKSGNHDGRPGGQ